MAPELFTNWSRVGCKLLASTFIAGAAVAFASSAEAAKPAPVQASCHFHSAGDKIKRVVFLSEKRVAPGLAST